MDSCGRPAVFVVDADGNFDGSGGGTPDEVEDLDGSGVFEGEGVGSVIIMGEGDARVLLLVVEAVGEWVLVFVDEREIVVDGETEISGSLEILGVAVVVPVLVLEAVLVEVPVVVPVEVEV